MFIDVRAFELRERIGDDGRIDQRAQPFAPVVGMHRDHAAENVSGPRAVGVMTRIGLRRRGNLARFIAEH